ncbi:Uncharacterized protein BM_BM13497 [Brugia malayi]|uniref:Bm13497 n=1 Tax=Brugia malayi TaxID=6279 RepID=A0A0J9Y873_BRUMA|nr:Uncharacterized protein BM_BM13497 [Brugia malayi]CDQ03859.1 Bm13497 [Brugia malayi]VIO99507.1 Uncharacterized protein BM_BM13497 [Brugia malayi]
MSILGHIRFYENNWIDCEIREKQEIYKGKDKSNGSQ